MINGSAIIYTKILFLSEVRHLFEVSLFYGTLEKLAGYRYRYFFFANLFLNFTFCLILTILGYVQNVLALTGNSCFTAQQAGFLFRGEILGVLK